MTAGQNGAGGSPAIVPDAIWQGKGSGHRYQLRIVGPHPAGDGRVVCERTAMPSAGQAEIGREITVTAEQLPSWIRTGLASRPTR